jgi:catechol 2,3-dioxygenase-like lactoylglutathione lyase family enzyme
LQGDATLVLGDERILLTEMDEAGRIESVPSEFPGPDVRFQHVAIVTRDIAGSFRDLQVVAPTPITRGGPQRLPEASGGATAFKFRDPDGHPLELIEFAEANCPQRWRKLLGGQPTRGIDHAAVSVSHIERSIRFYERMGFEVAARQTNSGPEQARLDGLDRVEVEVVAMKLAGSAGVHLELLGYTTPPAIRPASIPGAGRAGTEDRIAWASARDATVLVDPDGHLHDRLGPDARRRLFA